MVYSWKELGLKIPEIILPKAGTDYEKWAIVACDQYTSQPKYWEEVEEIVGDAPSTLRMILPEYYLEKPQEEERLAAIHGNMQQYLDDGLLETLDPGCILVKRTAEGRRRLGLVMALDLEQYDFSQGSTSMTRATERTVVERIPPRMRIRRGAPMELPHILILIDDPERSIIKPLDDMELQVVYDTDLMLGGGHVTGCFVPEEQLGTVQEAFSRLLDRTVEKYGHRNIFMYAVGDGNHSLATAKTYWEELKPTLPPEQRHDHPARYALCEIENVHDDGIIFEPIHRVVFGNGRMTGEQIARALTQIMQEQNGAARCVTPEEMPTHKKLYEKVGGREYELKCFSGGNSWSLMIHDPTHALEIGVLQKALNVFTDRMDGITVDYIHGDDTVRELAADPGNLGFLLPAMDKFRLFPAVAFNGTLPRKTFSMGEANEKRYYIEARKITK